jgi:GNAT superfamily N-acetyltransferase
MSAAAWHIRPYRPGDERTLVALWSEAFNRPMTEEHWRWKAKGRPAPIENVGVAVAADDRPIFQFVGIPCPAVVLGKPRTVMVGADVVTDPEFRRRGVFTATVHRLFDTWREAGVALVLGLANDLWGSRADALGYERSFPLRWLVRPLRPERVLARKTRLPGLGRLRGLGNLWNRAWDCATPVASDITVRPLPSATDEIDTIWERGSRHVSTSLVRDRAWVTWRYGRSPEGAHGLTLAERAGVPAGYAVYRVARTDGRTVVRIPEIFAPGDRFVLRALVHDVVARAVAEDAESVVTLAVLGSDTDRELRRAGFVFSPGAYRLEMVRLDSAISSAALRDPRGWWLTGGDFDVI